MNGQKLKVVDNYKFCREVHVDDDVTARIAKQVWHSEDSVQISGSEMESSLTPAESLQGSGTANDLDSIPASCKET